jgi:rfaE bifunctional protein kinase chain/domain
LKKEQVLGIFKAFTKLNILVIGDVMLDAYLFGKVNRISPEAPVPVVAIGKKENRLGGAANVALNISALGANPILCSVIGNDLYGKEILHLLLAQKINAKGIVNSKKRSTTVKTRVIGNNHQMLRIDEEETSDVSPTDTHALLKEIEAIISSKKPDAIVFEDYDKGCITASLIAEVMKLAKKKNIPVAVDPKKKNFLNYTGTTLFKPNLKELKEGLKLEFEAGDKDKLEKAVRELTKRIDCKNALVTLSEEGVLIYSGNKSRIIPAHVRSIADVSGAGDTVISVAALCMALQLEPSVIAAFSNIAGGLVCEKTGVVSIDKKQFTEEAVRLLSK